MIRLTDLEKKFLAFAGVAADIPLAAAARSLKCHANSLRSAIDRMIERELLIPRTIINVNRIGLFDTAIYLRTTSDSQSDRDQFFTTLHNSKDVAAVIGLAGDFQFMFSVVCKSPYELATLLPKLCERPGNAWHVVNRAVSPRAEMYFFPPKYLSPGTKAAVSTVYCGGPQIDLEIDKTDHEILRSLSDHQLQPTSWHSKALHVPASTLDYRIAKLKKQKIIAGYGYFLNAEALEFETFIIMLQERTFSPSLDQKLVNFATKHPHVINLIRCIAPWSYEVSVQVEKARQLNDIVDELHRNFHQSINVIGTSRVINQGKLNLYPK